MQKLIFFVFLLFCLFYLICLTKSVDDKKYEIKLNERISHLKKCVGPTGHLQHDERYDIFIIDVNKPLCIDLLRNSAQQFIFAEAPSHFDIYIPASNNVIHKCNSNFTLIKVDERVTKLKAVCNN